MPVIMKTTMVSWVLSLNSIFDEYLFTEFGRPAIFFTVKKSMQNCQSPGFWKWMMYMHAM